MKRPRNKWAIAFWAFAILIAIVQTSETIWMVAHFGGAVTWRIVAMGTGLINAAIFAGLGTLIEMTDQVRWQLRSLSERVKAVENSKL